MSYCVNCGVELDSSAKRCALCGTPIVNPNFINNAESEINPPFAKEDHEIKSVGKQFVAYVISMVILIPNIVCFFVNALFRNDGFWALYINATSFLAWVVFVFPFVTRKFRPYLMWLFDTLAVCAYVYFFFALGYERTIADWYWYCALPVILASSALILLFMFWVRRKKRPWPLKLIAIVADVGIVAFITGTVFDLYARVNHAFDIGVIIFVCCVCLIAFLCYCNFSKKMRKWLSKRFFV